MPNPSETPAAAPCLKVLLVDSRDDRTAMVRDGLAAHGVNELIVIDTLNAIHDTVTRVDPDVVILNCDSPGRDMLESLRQIALTTPRPVVMFVENSAPDMAREAIECGVSAYVVAGLTAERVRAVVDVAILRFRFLHALRSELDKTRSDLVARKIIERAKGILMEERKLSEDGAYRLLQRSAMDGGKSILAVAESLLSTARLLKK